MKQITFSPTFQKKLKVIKHKNSKLLKKIQKRITQFRDNPQHPSLRIHKLEGKLKDTFSLSVDMSTRILFIEDTCIYFFDVGSHDQIYR